MPQSRSPASGGLKDSKALMQRAREGEREAFDILVRHYANMVIAIGYRLLGSREEAMDCAQDAFVRAWENAARYNPRWAVATWLRRIATNLALDRLRRRKILVHFPEGLEDSASSPREGPVEVAEKKERAQMVWALLDLLPEKYRLILVLREMEGLHISEISQITDTEAATVRWRLHRARALFRDRWRSEVGGE